MLICPPDVITIGTVGYASANSIICSGSDNPYSPAATTTGTPCSAATSITGAAWRTGYASSPGCRKSPMQPRSSRQRRASADASRPGQRVDSSEPGNRKRRGASRVGEVVVGRAEVILERPAGRRDQTLDTSRDRGRDHVGQLVPWPEPVGAGDHEGVDDHAGTFSSRAALPPMTNASSAEVNPA